MRVYKRIDNKKTALVLREALRKSGATQLSLSGIIGVNQSQISRLLSGHFQRQTQTINALCIHLKISPVARLKAIKLPHYPELAACLDEVLDGSRKRERAVIRLLKSAQVLA